MRLWPGLLTAVVLLAACGDTGGDPPGSGPPTEERAPASPRDGAAGRDGGQPELTLADLEGGWRFDSGTVDGKSLDMPGAPAGTLVIADGTVQGQAVCNRFGGPADIRDGMLVVNELSMTAEGCGALQDVEDAFIRALRAGMVTVAGGRLSLRDSGTELHFVPAAPPPLEEIAGVVWELQSIVVDGLESPAAGEAATLELTIAGGIAGSTGCRELSGTFVVDADVLLTTRLAASGACPVRLEEQDGLVTSVIGDGFVVVAAASRLRLIDRNLELVYTRR